MTSQKSVKSLSSSGCGPLTVISEEMNSPVSKSKVSANVTKPASRRRTRPFAVWIFSGRPLKGVRKVIVPASSSTIGAGPLISPADEMTTDLPFTGFVTVDLKELVSLKLQPVLAL
jgi:hypothetical protein